MLFPELKAYSHPAASESLKLMEVFHPTGGAGFFTRQLPSETMLVIEAKIGVGRRMSAENRASPVMNFLQLLPIKA